MKNERLRMSPKFIALLVAGGIALTPVAGFAITDDSYNPGTFVKWIEQTDEYDYGLYNVKEGDNWSRISEKVCSHHRVEIEAKYWLALYYYNNCPKVIEPGDIIKFPKDQTEIEVLKVTLEKNGTAARIKRNNKVYGGKKTKISLDEVGRIVNGIYGDDIECIDPDILNYYLKITGADKKYELRDIDKKLTNDQFADLTKYIPTAQEFNEYLDAKIVKRKTK